MRVHCIHILIRVTNTAVYAPHHRENTLFSHWTQKNTSCLHAFEIDSNEIESCTVVPDSENQMVKLTWKEVNEKAVYIPFRKSIGVKMGKRLSSFEISMNSIKMPVIHMFSSSVSKSIIVSFELDFIQSKYAKMIASKKRVPWLSCFLHFFFFELAQTKHHFCITRLWLQRKTRISPYSTSIWQ